MNMVREWSKCFKVFVSTQTDSTQTEEDTAKRLMNDANISESKVSGRTVGRFLNSKGY